MTLPRVALDPVMVQTFDITCEKAAQPAAPRLLGQANLEQGMRAAVKFISRERSPLSQDRQLYLRRDAKK
jgi:hypothetical protein